MIFAMANTKRQHGEGDDVEILGSGPGWESYLQGLVAPRGPLSPFFVKQILDLWGQLERALGALQPPHAAVTADLGFSMSWDRGRHHFEVEIDPGSTYGWFYMDRASEHRTGEEDRPLGRYSPEMISSLQNLH
jgi:hypothetical protein